MKGIPVVVTKTAFRSLLILQKNAPNILFAGGVAGVVTSTVLACRATLKLSDELPEMKKSLEAVAEDETIPEEDKKKAVAIAYSMNAAKVAKMYAPSVIIGTISISALTGSHVVLTRRNAGLTAAYAAVSKAYDEYRIRVREDVGDDRELDLYHAVKTEKAKIEGIDKKQEVTVADPNKWSPYARFFDEGSRDYQKNPELNRLFIQIQQEYANNLLQARGHIFLNEVYDMLGLERSKAGQVVGWVVGKEGDNYVDFGIFKAGNERFVNNYEQVVLLDFNVDGVIYDKI